MKWIQDRMGWTKDEVIEPEDLDWEKVEIRKGHSVGVIFKGATLATYTLQVFAPDTKVAPGEPIPERPPVHQATEQDKRVLADLPAMIEMLEDALQDLLRDGYSVRISEWNK